MNKVYVPHAILASDTSALTIVAMATATKRPDKVLGLRFMIPVLGHERCRDYSSHHTFSKCVTDGNKPKEIGKAIKICCTFPMGPSNDRTCGHRYRSSWAGGN